MASHTIMNMHKVMAIYAEKKEIQLQPGTQFDPIALEPTTTRERQITNTGAMASLAFPHLCVREASCAVQ